MINSFNGKYRFLSNFHISPAVFEGQTFPSVEHGFQAAKTTDIGVRKTFNNSMTPGDSKRAGRKLPLRADWESVKFRVMEDLLRSKFSLDNRLAEQLIATGSEELVEGNTWNDRCWGVCNGAGQNNLGILLMKIRRELNENIAAQKRGK
jgi:ribA/ribD-fused uncharacterized protein